MSLENETKGIILVGMDFSANAHHALEWAVARACMSDQNVILVHVIDADPQYISLTMREDLVRALRTVETAYACDGVSIGSMIRVGTPWSEIIDAADAIGAANMVVGVRGQTAFARMVVGSTVDRIVRSSRIPVVSVHLEDDSPPDQLCDVVVGLDFSDESMRAMSEAVRTLRQCTSPRKLILVHACHTPIAYEPYAVSGMITELVAETEAEARRELKRVAAPLEEEDFEIELVAREGYPASVICQSAEEYKANMVFVGTHGRTGAKRLFLGSVAERVLHHAHCPVVTIQHTGEPEPFQLSA